MQIQFLLVLSSSNVILKLQMYSSKIYLNLKIIRIKKNKVLLFICNFVV